MKVYVYVFCQNADNKKSCVLYNLFSEFNYKYIFSSE